MLTARPRVLYVRTEEMSSTSVVALNTVQSRYSDIITDATLMRALMTFYGDTIWVIAKKLLKIDSNILYW